MYTGDGNGELPEGYIPNDKYDSILTDLRSAYTNARRMRGIDDDAIREVIEGSAMNAIDGLRLTEEAGSFLLNVILSSSDAIPGVPFPMGGLVVPKGQGEYMVDGVAILKLGFQTIEDRAHAESILYYLAKHAYDAPVVPVLPEKVKTALLQLDVPLEQQKTAILDSAAFPIDQRGTERLPDPNEFAMRNRAGGFLLDWGVAYTALYGNQYPVLDRPY